MKKTQEQRFLQVKEKLDYYRLPTIFPFDALELLSQLLSLLDGHSAKNGKENPQSYKNQSPNQLNEALRHQIGKVIKQNNRLHMELISVKEQLMSLKHSNDKLLIERSGGNKEMTVLLQNQRRRQDQLFEELTQVKFKYNQLMDLVHEDSQIQKKYIKRLMKHRKMEINEPKILSGNEFKKGQHQTVTEIEAKMILLQHKLANRESEIMRLQKRSQYDGLNMNKILKDFQNHRIDNKVSALQQQIQYLENQNKKMKHQVNSCQKKDGSKEALREQMRKNHETIARLQKENKELKKKLKQKQFDGKAKQKSDLRENSKIKQESELVQNQIQFAQRKIDDLDKKVEFLTRELDVSKAAINRAQNQNQQKDLIIDRIKNSEQGDKILAQYQLQSLKQKVQQLQSEIQSEIQRSHQLKAENDYHKQQDRLKNEAIQNLEKIVDELMKRNSQQNSDQGQSQYASSNLQNTIALRKNLAEMKQQLAYSQNEKQKIERQLQTITIRLDHKNQEAHLLNEELNRIKIKNLEMKNNEEQFFVLQRQVATLQSDLKKEQNFRYKIDQMHQQAQNDKSRLRKELQQLTQEFEIYERKSKSHMNTLKMQNNELDESNQMLELMTKQKDKKIIVMQGHIEELAGKIKLCKEQINVIEDEKLNIIREKHKFEKRCEDMMRINNESNTLNQQSRDLESGSLHSQILQYQKEVKRLHQKIMMLNQQITQLNSYCDTMKLSQENLLQQKNLLKRQIERLRSIEGRSSGSAEQEEQ